jgi:hypothetical protein
MMLIHLVNLYVYGLFNDVSVVGHSLLWISWQQDFYRAEAVDPKPNPQLGGPGLRICDPRRQGDPAIPQALGTILVAFYNTHELRWDYSYPPVTTRRNGSVYIGSYGRLISE